MSDEATAPEAPGVDARAGHAHPASVRAYSERLYAAWWVWLLPLAGAALLAASVRRGYPGVPDWIPYAVLLPIAVFAVLAMSRNTIRVLPRAGAAAAEPATVGAAESGPSEAELQVGQARLPVRFIGSVEVVGKEDKRLALGPRLDPAAYVLHRGSIGPLLYVELTDPEDATPYWLFSTRKPERLARALGADPPTD